MLKKILLFAIVMFAVTGVAYAAPLSAPSDLTATAVSSSQINLTWTDNSSHEHGFEIERSADGVNYSYHDEVGSNVESYSDTGLDEDTTYHYKARAFKKKKNSRQYGRYSNAGNDTTFQSTPVAPTDLSATVMSTSAGTSTIYWIDLSWTDNSYNESTYHVERSTNGIDFSLYVTLGSNSTSYTDYGVSQGTTHYYRVFARNSYGDSDYSNVASETP